MIDPKISNADNEQEVYQSLVKFYHARDRDVSIISHWLDSTTLGTGLRVYNDNSDTFGY